MQQPTTTGSSRHRDAGAAAGPGSPPAAAGGRGIEAVLHEHYQLMRREGIIMAFAGSASHEVLVCLAEGVRRRLAGKSHETVARRVFAVLVELAQNVDLYSAERLPAGDGRTVGVGLLLVTEEADTFRVSSANRVSAAAGRELAERCTLIASLEPRELRARYREQLRSARPEGKHTAGLGLMHVAQQSGHPLEWRVEPLDDEHAFFTIAAAIPKEARRG